MGDLLRDERENVQSAREALLRSYSSKSATHGTAVLALVVAMFTVFQIFQPATTEGISRIVASALVAFLFTLIFQMTVRTIYWGAMTAIVICVKPLEDNDIEEERREAIRRGVLRDTVLYRIENASVKYFGNTQRWIGFFAINWLSRKVLCALLLIFGLSFIFVFFAIFGL